MPGRMRHAQHKKTAQNAKNAQKKKMWNARTRKTRCYRNDGH